MNSFRRFLKWTKEAKFGLMLLGVGIVFIVCIALIASNRNNHIPVASVGNSEPSVEPSSSNSQPISSSSSSISSTPQVVVEKVNYPFSVDAKVARYFFDPSDTIEIRSQALLTYDNKIMPSLGVDYTYNDSAFDVKASFSGKVIAKNHDPLYGLSLVIEGDNGLKAYYCGLTEVNLYQNEEVSQGQVIGKSGESIINAELGNHLHFALKIDDEYINPLKVFNKKINEITV